MKFYPSDIYNSNFEELDYGINNRFSKDDIRNNLKNKPLFSYYSIDLGRTDYHFNQDCFDNEDAKKYFSLLNKFSNLTFGELFDLGYEHHLKRTELKGKLFDVLQQYINPKKIRKFDDDVPTIFHFGLYTSKNEKASREKGIKSPRIYFTIGSFGVIHILFYDPYHEINPTSY